MSAPRTPLVRLVGVYDAEGTLVGEVSYWVGARLGRRHCSLCDITHGAFRERRDWRECRDSLGVEFLLHHRDDQPVAVRDAAQGVAPVVLAEVPTGYVVLLGPSELEDCAGSVERFAVALDAALRSAGISVPS